MLTDEIRAFGFVFVLAILFPEFEPCHIVARKTPYLHVLNIYGIGLYMILHSIWSNLPKNFWQILKFTLVPRYMKEDRTITFSDLGELY